MKYFLFLIISTNLFSQVVPVYNYPNSNNNGYGYGMGVGMYPYSGNGIGTGGLGFPNGYNGNNSGLSFQAIPTYNPAGQVTLGLQNGGQMNYNIVRPSSNCPLLTNSAKEDQDVFGDLQNYFKSFSQKAECNQMNLNTNAGMSSVSQLESMLKITNSNGTKCYSKNVEQISSRNMALYYSDKNIDISMNSPYYACNKSTLSLKNPTSVKKDDIDNCIAEKYQSLVEENVQNCKEAVAPQLIQDQIDNGMVELERILIQSLSQNNSCSPKPQEAFKMAMNTFLKVKSLSVVSPWGAVSGFGADIIGSLLDKFFPSDSQKASALMEDILSEDNYEQNACLYYNIQQKMYCENDVNTVSVKATGCNLINVSHNLVNLFQNVNELKKVVETANTNNIKKEIVNNGFANTNISPAISNNDISLLEDRIEELTKYAKASEEQLRSRAKTLPKIQQAKELSKINNFYKLLDEYQNFNPGEDANPAKGQKILEEMYPLLFSDDSNKRLNFEELILKTTPGFKIESLKQKGIALSVEAMLASKIKSNNNVAEKSRSMAKYNKYKVAMAEMAQNQFKNRLEKQFNELRNQALFVEKQENGKVTDLVSEGMLRNLVRHCTLLQEIYDTKIEGKIPSECAKLNCDKENKMNWFTPKPGQNNYTGFKTNFCDKNFVYKKIEEDYIKDLQDPSGAKICGKPVKEFFR